MTGQYHLNLQKFSLARFKDILETEEMLPGRQILKEDIDGRFGILANLGIHNLDELNAVLRTKKKVEALARQSGLPAAYLTILRREAKSYWPKVVYFREFPGVASEVVAKLTDVGITHSKHLFDRGQTKQQREALATAAGLPVEKVLECVKLSDLVRVRGIGPGFARIFYEAGADTIETLSQWPPEALFQAAHKVNKEKKITRVVPSLKDMTHYVAMAGELDKAIEY